MKNPHALIFGGLGLLFAIAITSCSTETTEKPGRPPAPEPTNEMTPPEATAAGAGMSVVLTPFFNNAGIYPEGAHFSDGMDGDGFGCSSNLLKSSQIWNDTQFVFSPANGGSNVISCNGQTIPLPPGKFSKLQMLATGVNGAQADQNFTINYSDASLNQTFTQSISDWASPDSNPGESTAVTMEYRLQSDGSHDENSFYLFGYSFDLKSSGTATSIKLPDNENVKVFAITLLP